MIFWFQNQMNLKHIFSGQMIQFIFWIISKLVHVGIHHSNEFSVIVIHGKFFVKHRMAAVTDLFDLSQMAPLVL